MWLTHTHTHTCINTHSSSHWLPHQACRGPWNINVQSKLKLQQKEIGFSLSLPVYLTVYSLWLGEGVAVGARGGRREGVGGWTVEGREVRKVGGRSRESDMSNDLGHREDCAVAALGPTQWAGRVRDTQSATRYRKTDETHKEESGDVKIISEKTLEGETGRRSWGRSHKKGAS